MSLTACFGLHCRRSRPLDARRRKAPPGGAAHLATVTSIAAGAISAMVAMDAMIATGAAAADRTWIGATGKPAGDGTSFAGSLNWSPAAVPGAADRAIFDMVGGEITLPGGLVVNDRLRIVGPGSGVFFDLAAGVYRLTAPGNSGDARSVVIGGAEQTSVLLANGAMLAQHVVLGTGVGVSFLGILEGASLQAPGSLVIGEVGSSTLELAGELVTGPVRLGDFFGQGSLVADAPTAIWIALGPVSTGLGSGAFTLDGGALAALTGGVDLAPLPGGDALMVVSGLGTTVFIEDHLALGGSPNGPGGGAGLTIDDLGVVSVAGPLFLWPASTVNVESGGRLDVAALDVAGSAVALGAEAALVVDASGAFAESGLVIGAGPGLNEVEIAGGAAISAPEGAFGAFPGGSTRVSLAGSTMAIDGDLSIGWAPSEAPATTGGARLLLREGSTLDVGGLLAIRERGSLASDGAAIAAGALSIDGTAVLDVVLADSPSVDVDGHAALAGGLFVRQPDPEFLPGLNVVYAPVGAATSEGGFAAIIARPLPAYRFYQPLASDGVELQVAKLPTQIGLAQFVPAALPGAPNWIVAALFDGDALPDALVTIPGADGAPGEAALLLNGGVDDGPGFRLAGTLPVGNGPAGITVLDVNGSGALDAIVANELDGTLSIVLNNTGGTLAGDALTSGGTIDVGGRPRGIASADLFGTGRRDLIWADRSGDVIYVAPNNGRGGAGGWDPPQAIDAGPQPGTVNPIDVDDDKDIDVVVVNTGTASLATPGAGSSVAILSNQKSQKGEGFAPAVIYPVGDGAFDVVAGDLNGDGAVDLVTANAIGESISILVNRGDGTFHPAVDVPLGGRPTAIALGDLDNDAGQDLDIAVLLVDGSDNASLTILRNDSAGGQLILTIIENAEQFLGLPAALTSADLDGDGPADLIFVGGFGGEGEPGFISVIPTVPLSCPADLDGDGLVTGADVGLLVGLWGPAAPGNPADLNGDGVVNGIDLALLLGGWAPCPTPGGED
ncbi:MAG TPA: FG-GAP-like repeat-containing protein [Phycisphaerales bacterium]|nr:FG-GAP-like repeat-containing protein [Phycisphaerales bacterium]HMP36109.1 FG-GAP-like repeat-containing protein [Phycisphaerales bacterium]